MQNKTAAVAVAPTRLPVPLIIVAAIALLGSLAITVPFDPEWWKVVILGIVQGITEWLPISSTGHLLIVSDLLGYQGSIGGTFEIFIQLGTVISVVAFYFSDLLGQARALLGQAGRKESASAWRFWTAVLIAFLPAAMVGLAFRKFIKAVLFETPQVIAAALIVGGIIFLVIEWLPRRAASTSELDRVAPLQALGVGIAQIFALIPGMSRSGSSIIGGLLSGLDRRTATAFSFYLSIPILGLATLFDLVGSLDQIQPADWGRLILGAVVAMIVGYVTIGWLLRYIARHNFVAFGIYRIIVGLLIFALVAMGML
ncbi:MAG: undecaprenyl-diphosphate phosphatase [Chloroflexales bacterium]|nr:undecaprenyl-diphosphate phosphatase [Chloroflexales bacterium]